MGRLQYFLIRIGFFVAATLPLFLVVGGVPRWTLILPVGLLGLVLGQGAVMIGRRRTAYAWRATGFAVLLSAGSTWFFLHEKAAEEDRNPLPSDWIEVTSIREYAAISWEDVGALQSEVTAQVVPYLRKEVEIVSDVNDLRTEVTGATVEYFEVHQCRLTAGDFFTADETAKRRAVVLGKAVSERLFTTDSNAIGQPVGIDHTMYWVVGVMHCAAGSPSGEEDDSTTVVPLARLREQLAAKRFGGTVLFQVSDPQARPVVEAQVRKILRERHRLGPGENDDFQLTPRMPADRATR